MIIRLPDILIEENPKTEFPFFNKRIILHCCKLEIKYLDIYVPVKYESKDSRTIEEDLEVRIYCKRKNCSVSLLSHRSFSEASFYHKDDANPYTHCLFLRMGWEFSPIVLVESDFTILFTATGICLSKPYYIETYMKL